MARLKKPVPAPTPPAAVPIDAAPAPLQSGFGALLAVLQDCDPIVIGIAGRELISRVTTGKISPADAARVAQKLRLLGWVDGDPIPLASDGREDLEARGLPIAAAPAPLPRAFDEVEAVLGFLAGFHGEDEVVVRFGTGKDIFGNKEACVSLHVADVRKNSEPNKTRKIGAGETLREAIDDALTEAEAESEQEKSEAERHLEMWREQADRVKRFRPEQKKEQS